MGTCDNWGRERKHNNVGECPSRLGQPLELRLPYTACGNRHDTTHRVHTEGHGRQPSIRAVHHPSCTAGCTLFLVELAKWSWRNELFVLFVRIWKEAEALRVPTPFFFFPPCPASRPKAPFPGFVNGLGVLRHISNRSLQLRYWNEDSPLDPAPSVDVNPRYVPG